MKLVIFKENELIYDPRGERMFSSDTKADLHTFASKANGGKAWAIVNDKNEIWRFHEQIGVYKDLKIVRTVTQKEIDKHKIKTKDADFKDLEGETIVKFEPVDAPAGFWGDEEERYEIHCKSGRKFWMTTGGGTNVMGFPGSMTHGVWLEELLFN